MSTENPVGKAIADTEQKLAIVNAETRKRNKWAYIREDELLEWALKNSVTGSEEVLVRQYFRDAMISIALKRTHPKERATLGDRLPPSFNTNAKVEKFAEEIKPSLVDRAMGRPVEVKPAFFAIWVAAGEPEFPPTF